ncbi:hypothetical protein C5C36_17020, partial [Rathayibacter sp. AY1G1]
YPESDYDLGEVLQALPIGEAIVTVMNERGVPTPITPGVPSCPSSSSSTADRRRSSTSSSR